jgi:hypothetical protein
MKRNPNPKSVATTMRGMIQATLLAKWKDIHRNLPSIAEQPSTARMSQDPFNRNVGVRRVKSAKKYVIFCIDSLRVCIENQFSEAKVIQRLYLFIVVCLLAAPLLL